MSLIVTLFQLFIIHLSMLQHIRQINDVRPIMIHNPWLAFRNKQPNATKRRRIKQITNRYTHSSCVLFMSMTGGKSGLSHIRL